jgi:hypothetical protein
LYDGLTPSSRVGVHWFAACAVGAGEVGVPVEGIVGVSVRIGVSARVVAVGGLRSGRGGPESTEQENSMALITSSARGRSRDLMSFLLSFGNPISQNPE